jgi:hypothetical protein
MFLGLLWRGRSSMMINLRLCGPLNLGCPRSILNAACGFRKELPFRISMAMDP